MSERHAASDRPDGHSDEPDQHEVDSDFTTPADPDVETGAEPDQPA